MKRFFIAGAMLLAGFPVAQAGVIYSNINPFGVTNCAALSACNDPYPAPNDFTLTQNTYIHTVEGYFQGFGQDVPLVEMGLTNRDTAITVSVLAANAPDSPAFGYHQVATLDRMFAAGNYRVYASDVSMWAFNGTSGSAGLSQVISSDAPQAPEPATWGLLGLGLLGAGYRARSRRKE